MNQLAQFETDLWAAADNLRANSKLTSSDYFMPVLGIIFLRHAANRFDVATQQIEADQASGKMPKRKVQPADYIRRRALWLPESARFDFIMEKATNDPAGLPTLVTNAMTAIEADFEPLLNVLPKDYGIFESKVLEELMRLFNSEQIKQATGDVFGRIYEYFLAKFSIQKAHDNGEFFTPSSLVQTIVNVIEPDHGNILDPACGSGGMFVQSSHFIEQVGGDTSKKVVFYGQEKNRDTIRIAKMNLAVHGLEGKIAEAITYYQDDHNLHGKCDFVMANPPFNVDLVDAERVKSDPRLPFGLPGVNKDKRVSNGNYLWISYFWSYLSEKGRAGFVMSSQASSAGNDEKLVRQKIVETGAVDVMISIRSGFFYTRTVPCELWHFDRNKPVERLDQVLMLDARGIGQLMAGSRKVFEFTPEQMRNITAIVWLYRGQKERVIRLLHDYRGECVSAVAQLHHAIYAYDSKGPVQNLGMALACLNKFALDEAYGADGEDAVKLELAGLVVKLKEALREIESEARQMHGRLETLRATLEDGSDPIRDPEAALGRVQCTAGRLEPAGQSFRDFTHRLNEFWKMLNAAMNLAEAKLKAKRSGQWRKWDVRHLLEDYERAWQETRTQTARFEYFRRQLNWVLHRFPKAEYADVPGLCKIVSQKEIAAADWSLTPGRYVGVAPAEVNEDFDFEQTMKDIHTELAVLNEEAVGLAQAIQGNFEELSV